MYNPPAYGKNQVVVNSYKHTKKDGPKKGPSHLNQTERQD